MNRLLFYFDFDFDRPPDFERDVDFDRPPDLDFEVDFLGTLAPFFLASDNPIAMACLRLVTFLPLLPLFKVPAFFSFIAFSTFLPAPAEYFAIKINFYNCFQNTCPHHGKAISILSDR
jgi:hypothetical protein